MSNYKQVEGKLGTRTSNENKILEDQEHMLGNYIYHRQMVDKFNFLIKEIFICHNCNKKITNQRWVIENYTDESDNHPKFRFYHSISRCNPEFTSKCSCCGKIFKKKRKNQNYCSKSCAITAMNSPIILKPCLGCGKEFKERLMQNSSKKESYCPMCR